MPEAMLEGKREAELESTNWCGSLVLTAPRPRTMRAPERIARPPPAGALRPKPAAMRADDFAAVGAVLQDGRLGWFGHGAGLGGLQRLVQNA